MTFTSFRVASLFCRALTFWLWWSAGLGVIIGFINSAILGAGFGLISGGLQNGPMLLGSVGAAVVLNLFNSGLSAAMTGHGAFDEETLRTSPKLAVEERALVHACGGLLLLMTGGLEFVQMILAIGFGGGFGSGFVGGFGVLVPYTFKVGVGLFFAFRLGLKRLLPK